MDKFVEVFAKQNPKMNISCGNPKCGKTVMVNTKDYFYAPNSEYILSCPHCGVTTTYYADITLKNLKKEFKNNGITW